MSSSRTETSAGDGGATLVDVTMPQMGVSVAEGTVVAWRFEIGDRVQADETICEISTDKIDTEVPSPASGVLASGGPAVDPWAVCVFFEVAIALGSVAGAVTLVRGRRAVRPRRIVERIEAAEAS